MPEAQPAHSERESLAAYPTMSQAAEMLGVATSTLSRRRDRQTERRGERDLVMRPGEVLRLAYLYRKRSVNEVAAALIDLAEFHGEGDEIEAEVETFFAEAVLGDITKHRAIQRAQRGQRTTDVPNPDHGLRVRVGNESDERLPLRAAKRARHGAHGASERASRGPR